MKIFRNPRKKLLSSSNSGQYFKYALGEVLLLVVGILIALQINNWNTKRIENKEEKNIYEQIKNKVEEDRIEFVQIKNANNQFTLQLHKANGIISSKNYLSADTLAVLAMKMSQYSDFHGNGKIYENLVNSGDIKMLKNQDIINKLQKLELTYGYVNRLEDIHWEIIIRELSPELKGVINYSNLDIIKPEKLYSVEMQNIIIESLFLTGGKDSIYSKAIHEIDQIVDLVNLEVE